MKRIGQAIRNARLEKHINTVKMQELTGIYHSNYSRIEGGKDIKISTLTTILDALNMDFVLVPRINREYYVAMIDEQGEKSYYFQNIKEESIRYDNCNWEEFDYAATLLSKEEAKKISSDFFVQAIADGNVNKRFKMEKRALFDVVCEDLDYCPMTQRPYAECLDYIEANTEQTKGHTMVIRNNETLEEVYRETF